MSCVYNHVIKSGLNPNVVYIMLYSFLTFTMVQVIIEKMWRIIGHNKQLTDLSEAFLSIKKKNIILKGRESTEV